MAARERTRPVGRPRAKGPSTSGLGTEQDILRAAARLFCAAGYGGVSTHAIAREAGISQASMYHYFPGKHAILLHLLLETVQPSTAVAREVRERPGSADARLWALCAYDVRVLLGGSENTGALYLLPEIDDDRFAPFRAERQRLFETYRDLVAGVCEVGPEQAHGPASLVFGLVESVILRRRTEHALDAEELAPAIAEAALRVLGVTGDRLAVAVRGGRAVHLGVQPLR